MIITREQIKNISSEYETRTIYHEVKLNNAIIEFTKLFIFDDDNRIARNALWVLTKANTEEISRLQTLLNGLIDLALRTNDTSVRRLSLNIIERLEMNKEELRSDFLDFCLQHMTSIEELPGIQSVCMKLAFRMCKFYSELTDEFMRILESMEIDLYKPAVKSVRNKILKRRKCQDFQL